MFRQPGGLLLRPLEMPIEEAGFGVECSKQVAVNPPDAKILRHYCFLA
jgi:hypothetical protein